MLVLSPINQHKRGNTRTNDPTTVRLTCVLLERRVSVYPRPSSGWKNMVKILLKYQKYNYVNGLCHMTKMASMAINSKNL